MITGGRVIPDMAFFVVLVVVVDASVLVSAIRWRFFGLRLFLRVDRK